MQMTLRACVLAALACVGLQPSGLASAALQPAWLQRSEVGAAHGSALLAGLPRRRLQNATPNEARQTDAGANVNDSLAPNTDVTATPGAADHAGSTVENSLPQGSDTPTSSKDHSNSSGNGDGDGDGDSSRKCAFSQNCLHRCPVLSCIR